MFSKVKFVNFKPLKNDSKAILLFVHMLVFLCVCVCNSVIGEDNGECLLSSESKSPEKERAESGSVMCFQPNAETQTGREEGDKAGE